jgi:CRISPR-associated protein Cas1
MTVLYVQEQGAVVRRNGEEIRVTLAESVVARLPIGEAEQVVLCGNVQLTTQAAALLLQNEVDVVFVSTHGKLRGHLVKDMGSKFAKLRHAQLQLSGDEHRSLAAAKGVVRAKLANQRNLLAALARETGSQAAPALAQAIEGVERMRRDSDGARDADSLRGYEGKAGAFYFAAVGALLDQAWSFQGRKYYPAPDPFNAALSFGYALLQKDIATAISLVGLDPYLGCFHALQYDRPSLVLDLMEEFRPLVVDRALLGLMLSGKLKPGEFTFTGNPARPVELGAALIPRIIQAYEARAVAPVVHTPSGATNTLRRCFELQARIFARVVIGQREQYEGLVG